jgi:hypothetical protein
MTKACRQAFSPKLVIFSSPLFVVGTPDVEHLYLGISAQLDSGEQPTVTYCDKEQVGAQISAAHTVICIQQQAAPPFIEGPDAIPQLILNCMQLA